MNFSVPRFVEAARPLTLQGREAVSLARVVAVNAARPGVASGWDWMKSSPRSRSRKSSAKTLFRVFLGSPHTMSGTLSARKIGLRLPAL